ncbi:MAG: DUF308 domain-containing protein [Hyphomicrobiales bacterium]
MTAVSTFGTRSSGYFAVAAALLVLGLAAMLMPDYSNYASSTILGGVLAIAGIVTVWHAFSAQEWRGFAWELLKGAAEAAGGVLIYLNPMKGAAALTLIVAIVLLAQGVAQGGLGFRIRPQGGWRAVIGSGALSILVGLALLLRFPFDLIEEPGAMVGLAMCAGGLSYLVMALARRQSEAGVTP